MKNLHWFFFLLLLGSCDYFKQEETQTPIARVNQSFLYQSDLKKLFSDASQKDDSAQLVNSYINRWATQQLLIDQAKINLTQEQLSEFEHLVNQYRTDLYTQAYKNNIVSMQLDSTVSTQDMLNFYESNKENFRLNDVLLKMRYIEVAPNYSSLSSISEKLKRFSKEDQNILLDMSIQFKSSNLNDSTWIKRDNLLEKLPVLASQSQVLKKSNFAQLQDSLGVYLIKIEDLLDRNDVAPLTYVEPTILQIILNQRKQELIKKLETDITKDAIKNKTFEIYPQQ